MTQFIRLTAEAAPGSAVRADAANSFLKRFLGLMGRKKLPQGQGLLLSPCSSIHMLFMRFPIDAVWLDRDYRILKISPHLSPWLRLAFCPRAHACLELPAGAADALGWQEGWVLKAEEK